MLKNIKINPVVYTSPLEIINTGFVTTKYGKMFMAYCFLNDKPHICYLHFANSSAYKNFTNDIKKLWPLSHCIEDSAKADALFTTMIKKNNTIDIVLCGTDFQIETWKGLLAIPYGANRSYSDVAEMIKKPNAVRAVANAISSNNIAVLVPCHRVLAKTGNKLKYRWGSELKQAILEDEQN